MGEPAASLVTSANVKSELVRVVHLSALRYFAVSDL